MAQLSNREIVESLVRGERAACERLVDRYHSLLITEGVRVFRIGREDAEEIANDVLFTVVTKIGEFSFQRSDQDFHFWVMAIFRNRVRDFIRHRGLTAGMMESFDVNELDLSQEYGSTGMAVLSEIVRQFEWSLEKEERHDGGTPASDRLQCLNEAMEKLEVWERVLLRCRALDVPYEEISAYVGKPARTLKVYHGRVRKKLVTILAQHYPELISV